MILLIVEVVRILFKDAQGRFLRPRSAVVVS